MKRERDRCGGPNQNRGGIRGPAIGPAKNVGYLGAPPKFLDGAFFIPVHSTAVSLSLGAHAFVVQREKLQACLQKFRYINLVSNFSPRVTHSTDNI